MKVGENACLDVLFPWPDSLISEGQKPTVLRGTGEETAKKLELRGVVLRSGKSFSWEGKGSSGSILLRRET